MTVSFAGWTRKKAYPTSAAGAHFSTKWATFLLSLRDLVETGKGSPAPDDLQVGNRHQAPGGARGDGNSGAHRI